MAKRNSAKIVFVRDTLTPGIQQMPSNIRQGIAKEFRRQTPAVQSYAQRNAPWRDRTGAARNGLRTEYVGDRHVERQAIRLFHGVGYGIFLEVKNAGKYAIILPTIQAEGDRIMGELGGFLNSLTGGSSFTAGLPTAGLSL